MWGYPVLVLGAITSFLEPFRGHLSPNIDNVSQKLTLRYPHEESWVDQRREALGLEALGVEGVEGVGLRVLRVWG